MNVKVLIDNNLLRKNLSSLRSNLLQFNLVPSFHFCRISSVAVGVDQLVRWVHENFEGKILIITTRRLNGGNNFETNIGYKGYAESLGGRVAFVTVNKEANIDPNLCLHELFHLFGIQHCNERGCIMGFKLCNREVKYCVICLKPCVPLHLCGTCSSGLNVQ
jgi:predicted Zn-dependent protease